MTAAVLVGAAALAWALVDNARVQVRRARAERLASLAETALESNPSYGLALAVEAVRAFLDVGDPRVPAAERALRQALASLGGLALRGHSSGIHALGFSPDSRYLRSESEEGVVEVWSFASDDPQALPWPGGGPVDAELTSHAMFRWQFVERQDGATYLRDLRWRRDHLLSRRVSAGVGMTPGGRRAVTVGECSVSLWNLEARDPTADACKLQICGLSVYDLAWLKEVSGVQRRERLSRGGGPLHFSRDLHWLLEIVPDKPLALWDLTAAEPQAGRILLSPPSPFSWDLEDFVVSPDGRWLAGFEDGDGGCGGAAYLWALDAARRSRAPQVLYEESERTCRLRISPDSRWLAGFARHGLARLWKLGETPSESIARKFEDLGNSETEISSLEFRGGGRWLAIAEAEEEHAVRLWDLWNRSEKPLDLGNAEGAEYLFFSPDGHWLVATGGEAQLWRLGGPEGTTFSGPFSLRGHEGGVDNAVAFSPDGRWLVTADSDGMIRPWDLLAEKWNSAPVPLGWPGQLEQVVTVSPNDRWLVAKDTTGRALLWDLATKEPTTVRGQLGNLRYGLKAERIARSSDGHWWVVASPGGTGEPESLLIWDLRDKAMEARPIPLKGLQGSVKIVRITPDDEWVVAGIDDGSVLLWKLKSGDRVAIPIVRPGSGGLHSLELSPNGEWLATAAENDSFARLWRLGPAVPRGRPILLRGHGAAISSVRFTPDGRWLVTGSSDRTARLWDLKALDSSPRVFELVGHTGTAGVLAITSDSRWLITASSPEEGAGEQAVVYRWDLKARNPSSTREDLKGCDRPRPLGRLSPNDRWLAVVTSGNSVCLWDLNARDLDRTAGSFLVTSGVYTGDPSDLVFSPDSRWLAVDRYLWDLHVADWASTAIALPGSGSIRSFSPDGRWMVVREHMEDVTLHPVLLDSLLEAARKAGLRSPTPEEWERIFPGEPHDVPGAPALGESPNGKP